MAHSFSDMREKLRSAISSGALAKTDTLDDIGVNIFGVQSSVDFVQFVMGAEQRGVKLDTVDDLMRFMDQIKAD